MIAKTCVPEQRPPPASGGRSAAAAVLTEEQRSYAAENHNLILAFLRRENFSADDYYDIAALGFLRAVKNWFGDAATRRYRFSTIAWNAMRQSIASYHRAETRRCETEQKYLDGVPAQPDLLEETEYNILLHDLASKAGDRQYELAQLRMQGYSVAEVAKKQGMPPHRVRKLLKELFQVYLRLYTTNEKGG